MMTRINQNYYKSKKENEWAFLRFGRWTLLGCGLLLSLLYQFRIFVRYNYVYGNAVQGVVVVVSGKDAATAGTRHNGNNDSNNNKTSFGLVTNAYLKGDKKGHPSSSPSSSSISSSSSSLSTSSCQPQTPNYEYEGKKPLYVPAYPGSGSEMVRSLILAVTGNVAIDVHGGKRLPVEASTLTAKTHWPAIQFGRKAHIPALWQDTYSPYYVLLLRNPMDAIPSYFNHRYEGRMKLPNHSTQGPEDEWLKYRDDRFSGELRGWTGLIDAWKEQEYKTSYYQRGMILQYEALVASPQPMIRLSRYVFQNLSNVTTVIESDEDIGCLWYTTIHQKKLHHQQQQDITTSTIQNNHHPDGASPGNSATTTKRGERKYVPPYTTKQKEQFLNELTALKQKYREDVELVDVLNQYLNDINTTLRVVDHDPDDDNDTNEKEVDTDGVALDQNATMMR